MRAFLTVVLLVTLAVPADAGGRRRRAVASPSPREEVTIAFVGVTATGSDAVVDAGAVSRRKVRRAFGIRIDAPGKTGTVTLRAFLEMYDGRSVIRVDGRELGAEPIVIDAQAPIGEIRTHTLEIEIPNEAPEGAFASSVRWEATTNE